MNALRLILPLLLIGQLLNAQAPDKFAAYTDFLQEEIAEERIAGAVSLIVKDGEVIHQGAWGMSDREAGVAMKKDDVFHLMSMTKPIISVALMQLWEKGNFKLDDPVSKHLQGFSNLRVAKDVNEGKDGLTDPVKSPVTIRQILSHTAGFSHGLRGTALDKDVARALYYQPQKDIKSRVRTLTQLPMIGQPGEQWSYSASPDIAALLIEHFTGETVDDYLRKRIFKPLGMKDTGYNMTTEQAARMPKLYKVVDGELERDVMQMPANGHSVFGGSHGLLSTTADYGKFCEMLVNGGKANGKRILKAKTLELMTQNQIGNNVYAPGQTFGLGFGVTAELPEDGLDSVGRYYWSGAYSTFFFVDPANDLYAILMTQTSPFTGRYGDALRKWVYKSIK
ncbi:serine hydrolase domain-containing protein [Neolewinella persica]|uniref:serine hydrolase domain-containing protein n=1 Tax=Neolewinella persica TaxID=70998 RepID=UPI00036239BE|nr:serine hydrolase domain-containing protein [Neolewinella persica]